MKITWDQVFAWRLGRQFLDRRAAVTAVQVTERLCGVQAQVASLAAEAVAVRQARPEDPAGALASGELVRTWAMRGTLHLMTPEQARACNALIATAKTWEKPVWQRSFVTTAQMASLIAAARELLPGRELTREEFVAAAAGSDPELAAQLKSGWGTVLKPLAWLGLLCHGTTGPGGKVTFTAPGWAELPEPEEAARVAIPAYLGAYGPASMAAFDQWLLRGALKKKDLRAWFGQDGLTTVDVEGEELFAREADLDELAKTKPSTAVRLLPAFDQYVLGPGTADPHLLDQAHRADVSRAGGWISPVVVHAGRVVGTWERTEEGIRTSLWQQVPEKGLEEALQIAG
ncbi:winged helix DNA-binding domain-containing protein [Longispora albida]|uniref:winged helix DNA-binding domain-containing protein n=1 Tax=Longispora albida TaxID=203523 RepID=UPI00037BBDBD|nr:winged helix DNA-binding domain-containing protein [Longispora albida]